MSSSFFNGWSAHDIIGSLTRTEVRLALLDHGIRPNCFRTWDAIEAMIMTSSDEVKSVLYQSAIAKSNIEEQHRLTTLKRQREARAVARNVRRRLGWCIIFWE